MSEPYSQKIKEKAKIVEDVYSEAIIKVKELEKKQHEIVSNYIKKLEEEKIEKLKKIIKEK